MYRYDKDAGEHELGTARISSELKHCFLYFVSLISWRFALVLLVCERKSH